MHDDRQSWNAQLLSQDTTLFNEKYKVACVYVFLLVSSQPLSKETRHTTNCLMLNVLQSSNQLFVQYQKADI